MKGSLLHQSRLTFLFLILMAGLIGGTGIYWYGELEPRLNEEAQSHARILATAMGDALSHSLSVDGTNKGENLQRDMDRILLLVDPNTDLPFILRVAIQWDTEMAESGYVPAYQVRGHECIDCFNVETPLFHPQNHELVGIARFQVSAAFHNQMRDQLQRRILSMAGLGLLLVVLVWRAVVLLTIRLNRLMLQLTVVNEGLEGKVLDRTKALQETHERLMKETDRRLRLEQTGHQLRLELEEEERSRLATMLHDGPGQTAQAILLGLKMLRKRRLILGEDGHDLEILIHDAGVAIREIRSLTKELHPISLEGLSLAEAIRCQCARMSRLSGLLVEVDIADGPDILNVHFLEHLYRMFQEMLNNSIKHAAASWIAVRLDYPEPHLLRLVIQDNGRGFNSDQETQESGYGLHILKKRVGKLGGTLDITSVPGEGVTIQLEVKINDTHHTGR